jgi:hypothetical protein
MGRLSIGIGDPVQLEKDRSPAWRASRSVYYTLSVTLRTTRKFVSGFPRIAIPSDELFYLKPETLIGKNTLFDEPGFPKNPR